MDQFTRDLLAEYNDEVMSYTSSLLETTRPDPRAAIFERHLEAMDAQGGNIAYGGCWTPDRIGRWLAGCRLHANLAAPSFRDNWSAARMIWVCMQNLTYDLWCRQHAVFVNVDFCAADDKGPHGKTNLSTTTNHSLFKVEADKENNRAVRILSLFPLIPEQAGLVQEAFTDNTPLARDLQHLVYQALRAITTVQEARPRPTYRFIPFYDTSDRAEDESIHVEAFTEIGSASPLGLQYAYGESSMTLDWRAESKVHRSEPERMPTWKVCLNECATFNSPGASDFDSAIAKPVEYEHVVATGQLEWPSYKRPRDSEKYVSSQ